MYLVGVCVVLLNRYGIVNLCRGIACGFVRQIKHCEGIYWECVFLVEKVGHSEVI